MTSKKELKPDNADKRHNLALYITGSRIVLSPVFVACFLFEATWAPGVCLGIVILMELTDLLDGFAARRRRQVTAFGKLLDPYADSIYRLTAYICFLWRDMIPLIPMVVLFYRDMTISMTRILWGKSGVSLAARVTGKIKAWFQALGIVFILFLATYRHSWEGHKAHPEYAYVAYAVMFAALVSGVDYVFASREMYKKELRS